MNDYPSSYVARPRPLFVISGFATTVQRDETAPPLRNGPRIVSSSPLCTGNYAKQILHTFLQYDPEQTSSDSGNVPGDSKTIQVKIKTAERSYELPCRKASPTPRSPGSVSPPPLLHSSLSPLSPSSPLFPDGVMHPLWNTKWQDLVPAVYISFFELSLDSTTDESLKTDIIALKSSLTEHYRIRFAVVIVGESSSLQETSSEERLTNIRKATKLDAKTSFFYAPAGLSPVDQASFVQTILSALRPVSHEFYRDLTKHSRRKKDRWGGPASASIPENQITRALSKAGWVARYEWKMGVFAEFRFEMEAASRHFFAALDALFDSDGVLEKISNWSPRWNEVRLFADAIAIRQIRCLLANGLPMAASRFWIKYRDTTKDLLDRRGKGTISYGWKAWEARWARIMADLIQRSTSFAIDLTARKTLEGVAANGSQVYVDSDRDQTTDDPLEPWELLHHAGYWLVLAADISAVRRTLAYSMPQEDRVPPGQSPAAMVARRHETHDTYLCPEPHIEYPDSGMGGFDYCTDIVQTLQEALTEFARREQIRMVDVIRLRIAKELATAMRHNEALGVLRPLWQRHTWRKSDWPSLTQEVASILYSSAGNAKDTMLQISALWELLSFDPTQDIDCDLMGFATRAESNATSEMPRIIKLTDQELASFLDVSFTFGSHEAHASEIMHAQIVISSKAQPSSTPVTLKRLIVQFEGVIGQVIIDHHADDSDEVSKSSNTSTLSSLELNQLPQDLDSSRDVVYGGTSNLIIPPTSNRILNLTMTIREAGNIKALTAQVILRSSALEVHYVQDLQTEKGVTEWWLGNSGKPRKRRALRNPGTIVIHPKLPKVKVHFTNLQSQYYADERITLDVDVVNGEAIEADVTLEMRIPGHEGHAFSIQDVDTADSRVGKSQAPSLSYPLGKIPIGSVRKLRVMLQAPSIAVKFAFEAKTVYELESPLANTSSADIDIVTLFEPQYSIRPDLHPAPWPSFFHMDDRELTPIASMVGDEEASRGSTAINHRWSLRTELTSVGTEDVSIKNVQLDIISVSAGATCSLFDAPSSKDEVTLKSGITLARIFKLDTQRLELEDLRTTNVEAALKIEWCRSGTDNTTITSIPAPRLVFPSSEPRVLVSRQRSTVDSSIPIDLIMENPSMHFLSFNISLEPDETFAFSGPKLATKHLAPMSRHTIRYNVLPFDPNTPIQPEFKVVDIHYNKSLHINPTGDIQLNDKGILIAANI